MSDNYVGKSPAPDVPGLTTIGGAVTQVRLDKSGANLLLSRFNGALLTIDLLARPVPVGGVTLGLGGLLPSTTYYIYAFLLAGVMTLEASATAPSVDAATGLKVKSSDATRTLVGMARTTAGTLWADTTTQRFCLSQFNRKEMFAQGTFTADRTVAAAAYAEINAEIRIEFLTWGDESVVVSNVGTAASNIAANVCSAAIGFDGSIVPYPGTETGSVTPSAGYYQDIAMTAPAALAEGYHFATLLGFASGGSVATFPGITVPASSKMKTYINAWVRG